MNDKEIQFPPTVCTIDKLAKKVGSQPDFSKDTLQIKTYGDAILRTIATPVTEFDASLKMMAMQLAHLLFTSSIEGTGLAANQGGFDKRIIVLRASASSEDPKSRAFLTLVNPKIIKSEGELPYKEGCLSLPGAYGWVKRKAKIDVTFQDLEGKVETLTDVTDTVAVTIQHEIDHLNGVLFIDHLPDFLRSSTMRKFKLAKRHKAS